ncbi:hypothetical protein GCM10022202_36690 [Microbacterium marinilacus]|uniref:Uncharacterized protein n=3 Tax=Microbacterium marinilacus TaxID=415209 RepID=A0ABP7BY30_9MICO
MGMIHDPRRAPTFTSRDSDGVLPRSLRLHVSARWGRFTRSVSRGGILVEELTVLPPGATSHDRALLRLFAFAPMLGVGAGVLLGLLWLGQTPWVVTVALAGGALMLTVTARATRRLRSQSRRLVHVVDLLSSEPPADGESRRVIASCVSRLRDLDTRAGELSPVEYELGWARIYAALPSSCARR